MKGRVVGWFVGWWIVSPPTAELVQTHFLPPEWSLSRSVCWLVMAERMETPIEGAEADTQQIGILFSQKTKHISFFPISTQHKTHTHRVLPREKGGKNLEEHISCPSIQRTRLAAAYRSFCKTIIFLRISSDDVSKRRC
uniref:Putative secreted protein n=1 Tax=Anopheles marajoara TaxID=58244 RepID=A0A2M4C6M4_9DIPT